MTQSQKTCLYDRHRLTCERQGGDVELAGHFLLFHEILAHSRFGCLSVGKGSFFLCRRELIPCKQ